MTSVALRRTTLLLTAAVVGIAAVAASVVVGPAARAETVPFPSSGSITVLLRGNGHGHGMSQYGARGAAIAGLNAAQIVAFYYPGTTRKVLSASAIRVRLSRPGSSATVPATSGLHLSSMSTALGTSGISRYRLIAYGSALALQRLGTAPGSSWITARVNVPNGATFSTTAGTVRLFESGGVSTVYRGVVLGYNSGGTFYAVNRVSLDDYTAGVTPREMPASWQSAAVQAQAIAARSYGRNAVESRAGTGTYDICDTTQCQVYGGMQHLDAAGNVLWTEDRAALTGNSNTVLQYGGKTAFTQFSASSGGWTTSGGQPYLVAKQDSYDNTASGDPYLNWSTTADVADAASYYGLSRITQIAVTARDGHGAYGGRVVSAVVSGFAGTTAKQVTTTGLGLTSALGLPTSWYGFPGNATPKGVFDSLVVSAPRTVSVRGWTFDPNHTDEPGSYYLTVNGTKQTAQSTTVLRPDVQRIYSLDTATVGFGPVVKVAPGTVTVCVFAVDKDTSASVGLGCRTVTMPDQLGSLDVVTAGSGSVRVAGWALDPDHKDQPGRYSVVVDGVAGTAADTTVARADVQRIYATTTALYGFDKTVPMAAGSHRVCVQSLDRDGGPPVTLKCATVSVG